MKLLQNKENCLIIALLLLLIFSCESTLVDEFSVFEEATLMGMVYNSRSSPCVGAALRVDDEKGVYTSDINGRFVIPKLKRGRHLIHISNDGHEPEVVTLNFSDRRQILYIRLTSNESLLDWAEEALDELRWEEAEDFIMRSLAVEPEGTRAITLLGALYYRTEEFEDSLKQWQLLIEKGHRSPYLYLLIANTYEYGLESPEEARPWLERYLENHEAPEVRARLPVE
ncbi:hypothetical protein S1OALGB6SA_870 [Olavius algarvensis spirochete endosymbiont]|uniref:hypothetical protein n=1 Tax=Olavius algarvensis spirochete endosymbiont TaxID=260710 RepID=UPI000F22AA2F|nr:hypothetical protein [Olavius algarvensis spirochete endosymbiont]CAD7837555.1 MAG: hypothetical protein [Olavius algarvensis spirochete endosymbiont]VDA99797.1 hypothetical protein S1OALGB6SA_870 [Olavius algarvensis spirochete endosymbiont]